jgi:serine/threonine-protein phosphatase 2B regulatory subunit
VFFVVVHQRGRTQLNTQKLASHLLVEEFALYVMGGSSSKVGDSEEVQVVAETLGISRGVIKKLVILFSKVDTDFGGTISLDEFHIFVGINRTAFSDRAFGILDEDRSGELDFHEFIAGVWLIASGTLNHLLRFAFDIFDEDGSGSLDESELDAMFRMMYDCEVLPEQVYETLQTIMGRARRGELKPGSQESNSHTHTKLRNKEGYKESNPEGELVEGKVREEREVAELKQLEGKQEDIVDQKKVGKRSNEKKGVAMNSALTVFNLSLPISDSDSDDEGVSAIPGKDKQRQQNIIEKSSDVNEDSSVGSDDEIEVTLEEMYGQIAQFPFLLDPIVELQKTIRKRFLGEAYWKKMMRRREKQFGNENMDKILFEKKRLQAKKDEVQKKKREDRKMKRLAEIEADRIKKEAEEFAAMVEHKKKFCTQNEKNYREACKMVERAKLTLEEAERVGKEEGIDNVAQCAKLRQRLQKAKGDMEAALAALDSEWLQKKEADLIIARKKAEEEAIEELVAKGGPKMVKEAARKMKWVYKLLPRVDEQFEGTQKITFKECKERFKREFILEAIREAEEETEEKFKKLRAEELKFVQDVILENPWEEGQDPEALAKKAAEEAARLEEEALLKQEFMRPEDWALHLSLERTYVQSADVITWQRITKEVPLRLIRMAGINPVLKYKRLTAEEKKQLAEEEKAKKLKDLANKNAAQVDHKMNKK